MVERYEYTPYGERQVYSHGWSMADVNQDGRVNSADTNAFTAAVTGSEPADSVHDLNGDGAVDGLDIDPFNAASDAHLAGPNDPLVSYPRLMSDRETAAVTGAFSTPLCEVGHQGLFHDETVGLIHNRARTRNGERFLQRDPAGYPDGANAYGAYHVLYAGIDPLGLARLGVFSGINSFKPPRPNDSVNNDTHKGNYLIEEGGTMYGTRHSVAPDLSNNSILGLNDGYDGSRNLILGPRRKLDREAESIAQDYYDSGQFCDSPCPSEIRILMLQPKTRTKPPSSSDCANIEVQVAWSPFDGVPNQEVLFGDEDLAYWDHWGDVNPFQLPDDNHSSHDLLDGKARPVKPKQVYGGRRRIGGKPVHGPIGRKEITKWEPDGRYGEYNVIDTYVDPWMEDATIDYVFVCHSQGCNILMHVLNRAARESEQ